MVELEHTTGSDADFPWTRIVDFLLGAWLFASTFLWPHTHDEQMTAAILGILIAVVGGWAMFAHVVHYLNTLLAIWLLFSTLGAQHASAATTVNQVIVAIVVFLLSLVPNTWIVHVFSRHRSAAA
jgi:lysylphosphatidylglycerol synthetase-like protein (DUF2156 family)